MIVLGSRPAEVFYPSRLLIGHSPVSRKARGCYVQFSSLSANLKRSQPRSTVERRPIPGPMMYHRGSSSGLSTPTLQKPRVRRALLPALLRRKPSFKHFRQKAPVVSCGERAPVDVLIGNMRARMPALQFAFATLGSTLDPYALETANDVRPFRECRASETLALRWDTTAWGGPRVRISLPLA